MVAHAFKSSGQEAESRGSLNSKPPYLQSEFQDSQGYKEKPFLERADKTNKPKEQTEKDKEELQVPCQGQRRSFSIL